jgi:hypothetical protein
MSRAILRKSTVVSYVPSVNLDSNVQESIPEGHLAKAFAAYG